MLNIPFEKNRGNTCALSCYTMTARYSKNLARNFRWPGVVCLIYKIMVFKCDSMILDKSIFKQKL